MPHSKVERQDFDGVSRDATLLTWGKTETRRTQEPLSEFFHSNQAGATYEGQHSSAGENTRSKKRTSDQAELGPPADSLYLIQRGEDSAKKLEDNNVTDASEKYARKRRHKTRPDRYEYKDTIEKPSKKWELKMRVKKRSAGPLNHDFQAPNVASERLTLKPNSGPGFLDKGKSSADAGKRELPDLTFSEMTFLKRKRLEDDARFPRLKEQSLRKQSSESLRREISEFFSPPAGMGHEGECLSRKRSSESFVSWSALPLQNQQLSSAAQPCRSESIRRHEAHSRTAPSMVRPPSFYGDDRLEKFTTNALLHGVEGFATREKRCYSLSDLKKLAAQAASDLAEDEGPRHDIYTVSNANASTNRLHLSMPPISTKIRDSPHLTRSRSHRNLSQAADDCNEVETGCPGMQPSNHNRGQSHWGRGKPDIDRITSPKSVARRQLVGPACCPWPLCKNTSEMPGSSYHTRYSKNQSTDDVFPVRADSNLDIQGRAADATHTTCPPPAETTVARNSMNEAEALDTLVGSSGDLDEFDRKLLRLGTELALSDSEVIGDRESRLYGIDVETSSRDVGGSWCDSALDRAPDRQRTHDSVRRHYIRNVPMDSSLSHDCHELSQLHHHVPQGAPEAFSGIPRRHILY
ncbi:hypothetical protein AYL99_02775 [Fonsecaea erecta]|uniref:Uncharacterized protein n=1 Tax=Fonsecaea erecta TaxID=1367422 RepID=A0A178ZUU5_9EURO|nr:hypothetical protein AYL99_02775 [Fonsecaea erecta]OAP63548.1 hypothetical protein AYL99_02775 [Fonsecaea erecta]